MKKLTFLIISLIVFIATGYAQPGGLDLSFNPGTGADGTINTIVIQSNGQIIIGGSFAHYNTTGVNNLARINTDGSLDTTFRIGSGANAPVLTSCIQSDGKIIIGGSFTSYAGNTCGYIARIDTNGNFDSTFNVAGAGANTTINSVCLQTDEKIIMGGNFTTFNSNASVYIGRLNTDGSFDNTWGSAAVPNGFVLSTLVQPADGQILIGGEFTFINSFLTPRGRIARIGTTGNVDGGFYPAVSGSVYTIALQSNGQVVFGGSFQTVDGQTRSNMGCVDATGAVINAFNQGVNSGGFVQALTFDVSGNLIIGGQYASYGGVTANNLVRTDYGGLMDLTFNPGASGANANVRAVALQSDGKIIIGGDFTTYNDTVRNHLARLYACATTQPGNISGSTITMCAGTVQTYSINAVTGADNYTWTLPQGWTGSSDSTSITAISNGSGGVISVVANSSLCGASAARTDTILKLTAPYVPICLVTVDSQSVHNIIYWNKPQTNTIDSFYIYRLVTTDSAPIRAVIPYDSLSEYIDTDTADNPNAQAITYMLGVLDTCGIISDTSLYHTPIYLQPPTNGNLNWSPYEIQNTVWDSVLSYNIYRDDLGNGNFVDIATVSGNGPFQYHDPNYASFDSAHYVIDVNWGGGGCNPTRSVNTTRSNIKTTAKSLNGVQSVMNDKIMMYPNPASKNVTIQMQGMDILEMRLLDMMGEIVYSFSGPGRGGSNTVKQIDVGNLAKGIYTLQVATNGGTAYKKLIVQ